MPNDQVLDTLRPEACSVLVVDDTSANRRLYSSILSKAGFHVLTADDGDVAIEVMNREIPSLVLLDFMMPRMNGVEVLRHIRNHFLLSHVPVVVLTSSTSPDDIDAALEAGANDYITKPVNPRILLTRVKSIIRANRDRAQATAGREIAALREELEEASRVQRAQLPHVPVRWHDWHVVAAVVPSGRVGGDVFDVVTTDDERLVAFLLDVCGHGTASALVAAETRTEFKNLVAQRSMVESIQVLNERMARRETGKYSCVAAIEVEGNAVRILNAGLPPVIVLRDGDVLASVSASGTPVGMFAGASYEATALPAEPGDRIVLLSDGLTEPFGWADDSVNAVRRLGLTRITEPLEPESLMERILAQTAEDLVGHPDDATALILDLTGTMHHELNITPHPEAVRCAVQWVLSRKPDWVDAAELDHGMTEALTNAVLHGALELNSESRSGDGYLQYLSQAHIRAEDHSSRTVRLTLLDRNDGFGVRIGWDGVPCPAESRAPPSQVDPLRSSGLGMSIIFALFDHVIWAEDGLSMELWLDRRAQQGHSSRNRSES